MAGHVTAFLALTRQISGQISIQAIEGMVNGLVALRERGGRLFVLGSAAAPPMPVMPLTTFASCAGSRPMPPPTMSPN